MTIVGSLSVPYSHTLRPVPAQNRVDILPISFVTAMEAYLAAGVEMEFDAVCVDGVTTRVMRTKHPCAVVDIKGQTVIIERPDEEWDT